MGVLKIAVAVLAPPLCAACRRSCDAEEILCSRCRRALEAAEPLRGRGPQGVGSAWASLAHEGVGRELVSALKFRRLLPVAGLMADRVAKLAPQPLLSGVLVPVPTARQRASARGFDPAEVLASALAARTGGVLERCLTR